MQRDLLSILSDIHESPYYTAVVITTPTRIASATGGGLALLIFLVLSYKLENQATLAASVHGYALCVCVLGMWCAFLLAGALCALLIHISDACNLVETELLQDGRYEDYGVSDTNGLPEEFYPTCLYANGSGNIYEAFGSMMS